MQGKFELVVLDMDGTIYGRQFPGGISPRVRRAIAGSAEGGDAGHDSDGADLRFRARNGPRLGL